jgi:crotonobetainyl-CoA:carnitine CoA-transferase CaiB-like acyl-CoA transferase
VEARRNCIDVADPEYGDVCLTAPVPRRAWLAGAVRFPGQRLGASTENVLQGELNLSAGELQELRRRGVLG